MTPTIDDLHEDLTALRFNLSLFIDTGNLIEAAHCSRLITSMEYEIKAIESGSKIDYIWPFSCDIQSTVHH